jgi:hypothetical protein
MKTSINKRSAWSNLDERKRRIEAAKEAQKLGRGGVSAVYRKTRLARSTILRGLKELRKEIPAPESGHIRLPGGGRKAAAEKNPKLAQALRKLLKSAVKGDPRAPLQWLPLSLRDLAEELRKKRQIVSPPVAGKLLRLQGFTLRAKRAALDGEQPPDRYAQFEHINRQVRRQLQANRPAVCLELKRAFAGNGNMPVKNQSLKNSREGADWASIRTPAQTIPTVVQCLHQWWKAVGRKAHPQAKSLLVIADIGSDRKAKALNQKWQFELQRFADRTGWRVLVCHLPPGNLKWKKAEPHVFSVLGDANGGASRRTALIIHRIGFAGKGRVPVMNAVSAKGSRRLEKELTSKQMRGVRIERDSFQGAWNFTIGIQTKRK